MEFFMDRPFRCEIERDGGGAERLRVHVHLVRFAPDDVELEIDFNTARRDVEGELQFLALSGREQARVERLFDESGLASNEEWLTGEALTDTAAE